MGFLFTTTPSPATPSPATPKPSTWRATLVLTVGSSSFFTLLLPNIFMFTIFSDGSQGMQTPLDFNLALLCGCIITSLVLVVAGNRNSWKNNLSPGYVILASVCLALGYLTGMLDMLVQLPTWAFYVRGALFGIGAAILALAWSLLAKDLGFRSLINGCAMGFLASAVLFMVVSQLPFAAASFISVLLFLGSIFLPLRTAAQHRLSFPEHTPERTPERTLERTDTQPPTTDYAHVVAGSFFLKQPSMRDLLFMLIPPLLGLMLFTITSVSQTHALLGTNISISAPSLLLVAILYLSIGRIRWKAQPFPFIFWVLLPSIAATLLVLNSFPAGTWVASLGTLLFSLFCALLSIYAIAFLLTISNQGEFSPTLIMGLSLFFIALAALFGRLLLALNLDEPLRGDVLFVISTLYFVFLVAIPSIQLWRTRRTPVEESFPHKDFSPTDPTETCDTLSTRFGLSRREREIFTFLSNGYNSPYIANTLVISESTVRSHIKNIYRKMGVNSRMEIIELTHRTTTD